jgi:RNA polymerase sigma-70 factor (sigma-E family)
MGRGGVSMDFEEFVASRQRALLRMAYLLCGDQHMAEDIVQEALTKCYRRWRRVCRTDLPERYVQRVIVTSHIDWVRRRSAKEVPRDSAGDQTAGRIDDHARVIDDRDQMMRALERLPYRQRTILVLRYYEDLDDHAIAQLLAIGESTVRSQRARALAGLRELLCRAGPVPT